MPTIPTHAAAALGIGACLLRPGTPKRVWALGAVAATLPDADVVAFALGIPYEHVLGHRGLLHSLAFAAALAAGAAWLVSRGRGREEAMRVGLFLFLATASHGLLDMLTDGGLGVALLAPFDPSRYFFPVRPIQVSPIGVRRFLSSGGLAVLRSELLWVWLPAALLGAAGWTLRRRVRPPTADDSALPA